MNKPMSKPNKENQHVNAAYAYEECDSLEISDRSSAWTWVGEDLKKRCTTAINACCDLLR